MSVDQRTEFEERRLQLMRKHFESGPLAKAYYRKRRRNILGGFLGSMVLLMLGLLLLKSFMIAYEGQAGYARIVAPALAGQAENGLAVQLLGPDPISTEIAAALAPILPRRAPVALPVQLEEQAPILDADAAASPGADSQDPSPQNGALTAPSSELARPRAVLQLTE
jgi:hypothetical protein